MICVWLRTSCPRALSQLCCGDPTVCSHWLSRLCLSPCTANRQLPKILQLDRQVRELFSADSMGVDQATARAQKTRALPFENMGLGMPELRKQLATSREETAAALNRAEDAETRLASSRKETAAALARAETAEAHVVALQKAGRRAAGLASPYARPIDGVPHKPGHQARSAWKLPMLFGRPAGKRQQVAAERVRV